MKKLVIAMVFLVASVSASAEEFVWKGNENSRWNDPASYGRETGIPEGSGDSVVFESGRNATVTDADFNQVSSLGSVKLRTNSTITFVVGKTDGVPKQLGCPVCSYSGSGRSDVVKLVKKGEGALELASTGSKDYYLDIDVREGVLLFSQSVTVAPYIVSLNVAEGAVLYTPYAGSLLVNGWTFTGEGLVTNANPTAYAIDNCPALTMTTSVKSTFAGVIGGNLQVGIADSGADLELTGTGSSYVGSTLVSKGGRLAVKSFGRVGNASSVGASNQIRFEGNGGTIAYMGSAVESTDKTFLFDNTGPVIVDAGANGGVTFEGSWSYKSSNRLQHILNLSGENTETENVMANAFAESNRDGQQYNWSTYLCKKGSGIWRLADNVGRRNSGTIDVEAGTLRFDSVAPAGSVCSLGLSTLLTVPATSGTAAEAGSVPYAIVLGAATTEGTFEYSGTADAVCSTRPIAIRGMGRLRNGTDKNLFWENVFGTGDGVKTLTLDGDSTVAANALTTVTNANGTLSLVKEGKGTWTLDGAVLNGTVDVREGTLVVHRKPVVPTWYRLTIKQNYQDWLRWNASGGYSHDNSRRVLLQEFALYGSDGKRINQGLTYVRDAGVYTLTPITNLKEGETSLEMGTIVSERLPNKLFDGAASGDGMNGYSAVEGQYADMSTNLPSSWIKVVMRLPAGTQIATSYDYANTDCQSSGLTSRLRQLYAYSIDVSADGSNWTTVTNVDEAAENVTANYWVSDNTPIASARTTFGYPIDARLPTGLQSSFDSVKAVSVSGNGELRADAEDGATMTIKGLKIDPTKTAGTIDGFEFAEEGGSLDLTSLPKAGTMVKFNIKNSSTFANVSKWSATLNGAPTSKYSFSVKENGEVTFFRKGLVLVVR